MSYNISSKNCDITQELFRSNEIVSFHIYSTD